MFYRTKVNGKRGENMSMRNRRKRRRDVEIRFLMEFNEVGG